MDMRQLVYLTRISEERDKYIWEDMYCRSWDEIIGRIYLLKANGRFENKYYKDALAAFEQALSLFAENGVNKEYYFRALADKALVQCFLGEYDTALATFDQTLTMRYSSDKFYHDIMLNNRAAILVLTGAYSEALEALHKQLERDTENNNELLFTLATCLLHMERYSEAIAAYEQVIAQRNFLKRDEGLIAARQGRQPDWANF
jgi:tetratricopeptide (TPR) repeat protein